jgi:hypothetical protein
VLLERSIAIDRWPIGNETADSGMGDYVDPKRYNEDAVPARVKAIGYFEQVEEGAPDTKFASMPAKSCLR